VTPARLNFILSHLAAVLIALGLITSVYAHLHGAGMVIALAGVCAYGGSLVSLYLAWENGDV